MVALSTNLAGRLLARDNASSTPRCVSDRTTLGDGLAMGTSTTTVIERITHV